MRYLSLEDVLTLNDDSICLRKRLTNGLASVYEWRMTEEPPIEMRPVRLLAIVPIALVQDTLRQAKQVYYGSIADGLANPLGCRYHLFRELDKSQICGERLFRVLADAMRNSKISE
jgi:hypothetical protein